MSAVPDEFWAHRCRKTLNAAGRPQWVYSSGATCPACGTSRVLHEDRYCDEATDSGHSSSHGLVSYP